MPDRPEAGARYVPRAWAYDDRKPDDRKPADRDRLRRAGSRRRGRWRGRWRGPVVATDDGPDGVTRPVLAVARQLAELLGGTVHPGLTRGADVVVTGAGDGRPPLGTAFA